MIVDTNAYILSMLQVLLCCLIRDFLIPLFVWRNYLKKKSYSYRFWFCVITQAAFLINLVLLLGFLNICNRYTIMGSMVIVYSLIYWNYSDRKFFQCCRDCPRIIYNAYREDRLFKTIGREAANRIRKFGGVIRRMPVFGYLKRDWLNVIGVTVLMVYNIWFLTHNVMLYHCYQFSDIPVHQSWIYHLEHGTLFSDGIYPFGMHAMVYIIRVIFRLNLREIMLYAGAYQTVLLVIGQYILAREIFHAKYSPLAVILIFSLMLNQGRYAASLPQEAGMYAVIGLAYFMMRYLHEDRKKFILEGDTKLRSFFRVNSYINRRYLNSDALLLMLCVALVIAYHFYTAFAAVFLVFAIAFSYLFKVLKKQYFIPLMFCGIMGAVIAVLPFGACLAKGIPFQESMNWATSVMSGKEWKGSDTNYQSQLAAAQGLDSPDSDLTGSDKTDTEKKKVKVDYTKMTPEEIVKYFYQSIFNFGTVAMFGGDATQLMFDCMLFGFFCALVLLLSKRTRSYGHDYQALILYMIILCIVGAAASLGIPELIAAARASTFAEPFVGLVYMLPVDFAFRVFSRQRNRYFQGALNMLSAATCVGAVLLIFSSGCYHAFFDVNLAYYNESEYVLRHIKQSYAKDTYTIVSPTEEYYDVLDYGYHTELSEFLNMVNKNQKEFTFPTEYVFFFIEKRALLDQKYKDTNVQLKYAAKKFTYMANSQDYYFQRVIIESQAYYWAHKFQQIYPRNFKIFYEDDIYVVYKLEQNTYYPYSMQIDYLKDYRDEIAKNGWDKEDNNN